LQGPTENRIGEWASWININNNNNNNNNKQLLDEVEQNIVICQWRADQLFADAEGRGK